MAAPAPRQVRRGADAVAPVPVTTPLPRTGATDVTLKLTLPGLTRKLKPGALTAETAAKLIDEIAAEPPGKLRLAVIKFSGWPAAARTAFFELWAAVRSTRAVTVRAKKVDYTKPLDFVMSLLDAATDADNVDTWVEEAATVVAVCYPAPERAACAAAVVQHLQTVGFGGVSEPELLARVAAAAGDPPPTKGGWGPNPTVLARDFVDRHRVASPVVPTTPDDRVLHYFAGTFYAWRLAWRPISPEEMRALVVHDLQMSTGVERVTAALVSNVLENLKGLCLVTGGDNPLPFHIADYGPPAVVTGRKMVVLQNGMIDLEAVASGDKPQRLPHDPRWFGTSLLPFAFDPAAKCPTFHAFLRRVLERDPETAKPLVKGDRRLRVLQEWFGYTLLCDARFQKFLLMVGEGSNGKGVIQNVWERMLGKENVAHVGLAQLGAQFGLQPLLGKMANICGDLCDIDGVAEGVLKRLTGEDNITVDRKNQPLVTMSPTVKLVFGTNTLPRFADKSRGVWRRLMAMPFRVVIPDAEQDELLAGKLTAELPGILNWALRGLRRLLEQGQFTHCVLCAEAARQHQLDCDPVAQFLDEAGVYPPPCDGVVRRIPKDELHTHYRDWCEKGGYKPLARNGFNRRIGKLDGILEYRSPKAGPDGKRPYYWVGIGPPLPMPPDAEDEDDEDDEGADEEE